MKKWRKANQGAYRANKELVDLSRAFGLRRSEIFGKSGSSYKGLTFRNLGHVEGSQRLFAEVIGKGGKYRVVPVLEAFKGQMWARYGVQSRTYPKNYFQKPAEERARLLKSSLKSKERLFQTNKSNVPLHINRNEYVERMLKERQKHYEKSQGKITWVGGKKLTEKQIIALHAKEEVMVKGIKGKKNKYDAPVILDYNMNMWVIIITFSIISHFNRS